MNEFQARIGVGRPHPGLGRKTGDTRTLPVTIEEGPRRGTQGGWHTEHRSGRVDATITPPPVTVKAALKQGD